MKPPFDLIYSSWPRPVEKCEGAWASEPEWDTPAMPRPPQLRWDTIHGNPCWMIDWREYFTVRDRYGCGEMRGFHVIFELRMRQGGRLAFWNDDGCIIRRNGVTVHHDKHPRQATRTEIEVDAGDILDVAHWQDYGHWVWGARLAGDAFDSPPPAADVFLPYLSDVQEHLRRPDGPPLKIYTDGRNAARAVLAVYSMILNGYTPQEVVIFGDYQWSESAFDLFATTMPFARSVSSQQVKTALEALGGGALFDLALRHWWIMKGCVGLLCEPWDYCQLDDDVFVLGSVKDACDAFQEHDIVFAPDMDNVHNYRRVWPWMVEGLDTWPTTRLNGGLYWLRAVHDPRAIVAEALKADASTSDPVSWEQGLISALYAREKALMLSTQRYFYPVFDGLPGGVLGYDWRANPCGFATVHFGGLGEKPSDPVTLSLAPQILDRKPHPDV